MLSRRALIASTAALAAGCGLPESSSVPPGRAKRVELSWASGWFSANLREFGAERDIEVAQKRIAVALEEDRENPNGPVRARYTLTPHYLRMQDVEPRPQSREEQVAWYGGLQVDLLTVNTALAPMLAQRGVILPLDRFIAADDPHSTDTFYPYTLDAFRTEGGLLALPVDAAPQMIHFNPLFFEARDVSPLDNNWTWRDLVEIAEKLTRRDDSGEVKRWGLITQHLGYWWALWQNEADVADPHTKQCRLQEKAAAEALQFCSDLMHVHRVSPLATSRNVGLMLRGLFPFWTPLFFSSYRGTRSSEYRWAALPRGKVRSVPVSVDTGIAIHARSQNPELAYTALKGLVGTMQEFVTVPAQKEAIARLGDFRKTLLPAEVEAFQKSMEFGRALPQDRSLWRAMNAIEEELVNGEVSSAVNAACSVLRASG